MDQPVTTLAFTIPQFCKAHNVSRSQYYELRKDGRAPVEMEIGRKKLISHESAADWRRRMEVPPDDSPEPTIIEDGAEGQITKVEAKDADRHSRKSSVDGEEQDGDLAEAAA